jgi:futalosine hydrolase
MPIGVGTFAKHFIVFLCAPFLTIHSVSGIKMLFARYVYHHNNCGCKYTKQKQGICFILVSEKSNFLMRILIVAATLFEVESLKLKVESKTSDFGLKTIDFLITGAGMVATAFALGQHLAQNQYDLAINLGIAGSFDRNIALGDVVEITEDTLAELGAEDDEDFITIDKLGFGESTFRSTYTLPECFNIKKANAITVNTVHGNDASIKKLSGYIDAQIESMEGAAFFYACKQVGVPSLQIRAVSNYVEKRNRDAWQIGLAIKNLNTFAGEFLARVASGV